MSFQLKVANYNLWHGLNGRGWLKFGDLEPQGHRARRYSLQLEQLQVLNADLLFLQEVSPLYPRVKSIAKHLKMDWIAQYDQAGLRVGPFGLPWNLQTGLAILAKPALKLRQLKSVKLSGSLGFCSRAMSFQLSEFRYALFGVIELGNEKIEVVNTHLHHGPVISSQLGFMLEEALKTHSDLKPEAVLASWRQGEVRRAKEVAELVKHLGGGPRIMAGDFNVDERDQLLQPIGALGLKDIFEGSPLQSWNRLRNAENHRYTRELRLPVSTFGKKSLDSLLRDYDSRPRRIDYIWATDEFHVLEKSLAMDQPSAEGLIGSDHFGLQALLSF